LVQHLDRTNRRLVRRRSVSQPSGTVVSPEKRRGGVIGYCQGAAFSTPMFVFAQSRCWTANARSTTPL
jgi:hypothetical protein